MSAFIIPIFIVSWLFIGYITTLISFKIAKWDIDDIMQSGVIFYFSLGGLFTTFLFLLIGIMYILMVIPYKIIFPDRD